MPAMLAAALAGCAALTGTHPGGLVVKATAVNAPAGWEAPDSRGGYRGIPVKVPFCRVEGMIEGNIGFELWLPERWNGRLLGAGVGGDAGVFNYIDMSRRITEGFATVTTDSGHKASQARWMSDPKARVDYEHRAVHLTALAAKALAGKLYGRAVDRSYFTGCSGGGRQALKQMQNYPGDYDGVIAGAPGPYMPLQSVRMLWFGLQQKWTPAGALSDADWSLYEAKATAACDANDGVRDGIISNPLACNFKAAALLCKPGQTEGCLTAPKLTMLNLIRSPMKDEAGRVMDGGLFAGVRTRPGAPSPLLRAMWADGVYNDPDWNEDRFKRTADLNAANRVMPELRADKVAISPFLKVGGKAIIYQGWADPSTNAGPTIDYYGALARANGGLAKLDDSVRLFMAPGMYHCRGGPGPDQFGASGHISWPGDPARDTLWALIRWVEKGQAPARITATKLVDGQPKFTRTLCPYPQAARYDGKGPKDAAASYRCVVDPALVSYMGRRSLVGS
ncbi:tannase/feruloyl esterase family alpha/beta hydrolase [Sphingomonas sp. MG17]|uniref:Tannase/feruloyl esterase family alpha/beta hydrolase n=1 Tax=Sphingomonas tagetis TaxID=2949092 RepID=A0A9X2KKC0_9SPHN|nr:tannase/feruloyl esterase family alpha/beta hydrolase [Sphingomonas tagetis]MCP3729595.1 tannase/feruloyl esterase family alpha/beta hydrolase [Sphingomonas tagetis]